MRENTRDFIKDNLESIKSIVQSGEGLERASELFGVSVSDLKEYLNSVGIRVPRNRIQTARDRHLDSIGALCNHETNKIAVDILEKRLKVIQAEIDTTNKRIEIVDLALSQLTDTEKTILTDFFIKRGERTLLDVQLDLSEKLFIDRNTIYEYREKALEKFECLMHGSKCCSKH